MSLPVPEDICSPDRNARSVPPTLLHYTDVETALDRPERLARLSGLIADLRDERTVVVGTATTVPPERSRS